MVSVLEFLPGSATASDLRYLFDRVVLRTTVGGSSNNPQAQVSRCYLSSVIGPISVYRLVSFSVIIS